MIHVTVLGRAALAVLVLAGASAACGKAQARTALPSPPLDTPAAPDRLIVAPSSLPAEPETTPPAQSPPPATPQRARDPQATGARTTDKPTPPVTGPLPTPATDTPPPVLQTTANASELEQDALRKIASAERDLDRVVLAQLNDEQRSQYNQSRAAIRLAQSHLKIKNFVLARAAADIAATLASALVK
jgi:hypothetical protein